MTTSRTPATRRPDGRARESGAAMVEFALVLPLLLVVLFGALDFGKAFNYWIDETHLANKAARWAAVDKNPSPDLTLQEYVRQQANTPELADGLEVCIGVIDLDGDGIDVGDAVTARTQYTYDFLPFLDDFLRSDGSITSVTIDGEATMRLEAVPEEWVPDAGCSSGV